MSNLKERAGGKLQETKQSKKLHITLPVYTKFATYLVQKAFSPLQQQVAQKSTTPRVANLGEAAPFSR